MREFLQMDENVFDWKLYLFFAVIFLGLGLTVIAGAKMMKFI
jgi:hypothetical protein